MLRKLTQTQVIIVVLFCCMLCHTACVNQIEEEIRVGNIPISFVVKTGNSDTRTSGNKFEIGDKVGLFAMITGNDIGGQRYIDNLSLTAGEGSALTPSKSVFYPEGDGFTLDFISYYPYQDAGVAAGSSILPVAVQTDQSNHKGYADSDFLVAQTVKVASSDEAVQLSYAHQMAKIKITLTPDKEEDLNNMKNDDPRIVACGFYTRADYDLQSGTFSNQSQTADIITSGEWKIEGNQLTGKEFIVMPQSGGQGKSLQMEWNGRIYSCALGDLTEINGNKQYEIEVKAMQTNSHILSGVVGNIQEWPSEDIQQSTSDNKDKYTAAHLSVLSFASSKVYRVYSGGKAIAEICKEYLNSDNLTSQAIVAYPVANETADLKQGVVLQLADISEPICGGTISWGDDGSFSYTSGTSAGIDKIYFDAAGQIQLDKPESPINIDILQYTLRDVRSGLVEYPIVKVGTQYWMAENLRATRYQDGTPIAERTTLNGEPGYFKPKNGTACFYNGEALLQKEISPSGWKLPTVADWAQLEKYIGGSVSLLKAGEWQSVTEQAKEVAPVTNKTLFGLYALGIWSGSANASVNRVAGFWSWDEENNKIPAETVFFSGESDVFLRLTAITTDEEYYKGLSIRCIKK